MEVWGQLVGSDYYVKSQKQESGWLVEIHSICVEHVVGGTLVASLGPHFPRDRVHIELWECAGYSRTFLGRKRDNLGRNC